MQEQRNNYGKPHSYIHGEKNKEIEMQPYNAMKRDYNPEKNDKNDKNEQGQTNRYDQQDAKNQTPYISNYLLHLLIFFIAFAIFIAMWAIDTYATGNVQSSYYYKNQFLVSSNMDVTLYANSLIIFDGKTNGHNSTIAVSMSLIFSWVFWKMSLIVYTYHITSRQQSANLRIGTTAVLFFFMLGADIIATIFLMFYNDYIFLAVYLLLSTIVVSLNCKDKKQAIKHNTIPILWICLLNLIYCWLIPSLYKIYVQNMSTFASLFLIFYGYPVIDLALYSITLALGSQMERWVKNFFHQIHFYLLGYGVGMILLVGYTEVQFYYLIAYFIFRNIFVNYIMRKWQFVVSNPPALPGWGLCYFASYGASFLPIIGVGKIVISKSLSSYIFALTPTLLYGVSNPLYPSKTAPTSALSINYNFDGKIYWLGALIIWVALTFSQRYNRTKPKFYDLMYYLLGIYIFYLGISSSLSLQRLYSLSTFN